MIADYKTLKAVVTDWMDRPQLAGEVSSVGVNIDLMGIFTAEVETKINDRLRTEDMIDILFNRACDEQGRVNLPDNILGIRLVTLNGVDCDYLTPEQFTRAKDAYCGEGSFYTRANYQMYVYPAMQNTDDLTLIAYVNIPPLVKDADTNWMLRKYPAIYMYGCLAAACAYVVDTENEMKWIAKFEDEVQRLVERDSDDRWSGSSMQVRTSV